MTRIAWTPSANLGIAEWSAVGRRFGQISRCSQWWLGDWIKYGNAKFGERYSRAVKLTGYDVQSLMNMVYVATRFDISRRREDLSWSHHATVAALDLSGQEHWLARAVADKMSVSDLRTELRTRRRMLEQAGAGAKPAEPVIAVAKAAAPPLAARDLVCPNCGAAVPLSQ
jgi:hypothetical protein